MVVPAQIPIRARLIQPQSIRPQKPICPSNRAAPGLYQASSFSIKVNYYVEFDWTTPSHYFLIMTRCELAAVTTTTKMVTRQVWGA